MKFKNIYLILIILIFLSGCKSIKEGLEGSKKSKSAEEFLIKKKNPLVLPPNFSKLPEPVSVTENENENEFDLKEILDGDKIKEDNEISKSNSSLQNSIIKKIQKN